MIKYLEGGWMMNAKKKVYVTDFTEGSIAPKLMKFALPLFAASLLQVVYNMVDMIIVGQRLGKVGLSAVSIGGDVSNFLTFIAMGFANAGQVIISQYIGAKKHNELSRFIGTMVSSLLMSALIISGVCLFLREPVLAVMNTPIEAWDDALGYSTVCIAGLVFIYGYNVASAILRGMGDSKHPFIFIAIASIINVILDVIFVLALDMRAMGAALATVMSQGTSFLLCAWFVYKKSERFGLKLTLEDFLYIEKEKLGELIKLGLPMAIKSASIQFSKLFVNSYINSYGIAVSGFAGIANKINSISNLISNSMNTAGSSMVGQNIGAKKYKRVPHIIWIIACITLSIATLFSILIYSFPEFIFSIFTSDLEVIKVGIQYLPVAVLIFFGSACRAPMNALINGSGNYKINFATAILDGIVMRIGLALILGIGLQMEYLGFWFGDALAGFTPMVIGLVFLFSGKWKASKV